MFLGVLIAVLLTVLIWNYTKLPRQYAALRQNVVEYDYALLWKKVKLLCKYIWPSENKVRVKAVICLLLIALGCVFNLVVPLVAKWAVDELTHKKHFFWDLVYMTFGFFCLQGNGYIMEVISNIRAIVYLSVKHHTSTRVRVDIYRHLIRLPYSWYAERSRSELGTVYFDSFQAFESFPEYIIFQFFPSILDAVIAIVFFVSTFDFYLTVMLSSVAVVYVVSSKLIMDWEKRVYDKEEEEYDKRSGNMDMDGLYNNETVKYFCNEELEIKRFKEGLLDENRRECRRETFSHFTSMVHCLTSDFLVMLGTFLMAYQRSASDSTDLTAGDYILFTSYFYQFTSPLHTIEYAIKKLKKGLDDAGPLIELLELPVENDEAKLKDVEIQGGLKVENVTFSYVEGTEVLHDVSFEVPEGKTVALVGPTGSGKSTMIRMLYRFLNPTEGTISINGINVRDLDVYDFRRQIGVVPQDCVLFNDTIKYNLDYAKPGVDEKVIEEATRAAQIDEMIQKKAEKYDTKVGERGMKLSGGEKQRMAIARTILKNPKYLFMDEATSSLDTLTERQIQKALTDLAKNKTCVIVAHRLSTIVHADNIVVLKEGRVLEQGNHKKLMENNGLYAKMWNLQQGGDFNQ